MLHEPAARLRPRLQQLLKSLRLDITYKRGRGVHLYDDDGEVLDLVGGFGSLWLGHSHPALVAEAQRLLAEERPLFVQGSNRESAQLLAEELSKRVDGDFVTIFGNSGAEAVEVAMKHAMLKTGSKTFIALEGAFHGKTLGALQLTANPYYRDGFDLSDIRVIRVAPDDRKALKAAFEEPEIAGFVYEPILGEGGVRPLTPEFAQDAAELCRKHGAVLIADECQTGLGRTGRFLASENLGVEPDCVILAKALGGGLAKISACLIRRESYDDRFDLRHSSTFADDDFSSSVALKTLELIDDGLLSLVRAKGQRFLSQLQEVVAAYPDILAESRGAGLMLGVEFRPFKRSGMLLSFLSSQDDLVKLLTGYFLHEHRIRVMPMLSSPFTLRLQPSALIADDDWTRFICALEDVCAKLRSNDVAGLTRFLLPAAAEATIPRESPKLFTYNRERFWSREHNAPERKVAWLCHLVDTEDLVSLEPGFAASPPHEREALLGNLAGQAAPILMSSVDVESRAGGVTRLYSILLPVTSSWIKNRIETGDLSLPRALVQQGVDLAAKLGCSVTSLGQYTSIVTANGMRLDARGMGLTSGNSYTVALAIDAVNRAMSTRCLNPATATLAVVGAAGNIGRACASIAAPRFGQTILVGSDTAGGRARLQPLVTPGVRIAADLSEVQSADVVISASNATKSLLYGSDFRPGAIVCDVSAPCSVDPAAAREQPDAQFIKGGVARLPFDDDLEIPGFPLPLGQTFACMAEGILLGMEGIANREFTGALRPDRVKKIGRIAKRHGFELAGYKTGCVLGTDQRHARHQHINSA